MNSVRGIHPTDLALLMPLVMSTPSLQEAVLKTVVTFISNEMRYTIANSPNWRMRVQILIITYSDKNFVSFSSDRFYMLSICRILLSLGPIVFCTICNNCLVSVRKFKIILSIWFKFGFGQLYLLINCIFCIFLRIKTKLEINF